MNLRRDHFNAGGGNYHISEPGTFTRFFFWPFKRKKEKFQLRSGALQPDEVRRRITEIGIGKQVELLRIGYDGTTDDMPIVVEIIDLSNSGFTGRIVNLERLMIESATRNLIYAKRGGGVIEFFYNDGDIKDITLSRDKELLEKERNISSLKEILAALEKGDRVIVAYFDSKHKGTINTEGVIVEKDDNNQNFTLKIEKINRIELEKKISKEFNLERDLVVDIEMV